MEGGGAGGFLRFAVPPLLEGEGERAGGGEALGVLLWREPVLGGDEAGAVVWERRPTPPLPPVVGGIKEAATGRKGRRATHKYVCDVCSVVEASAPALKRHWELRCESQTRTLPRTPNL